MRNLNYPVISDGSIELSEAKKKAAALSFCLNLPLLLVGCHLKTAAPRLVCGPKFGF